MQMNQCIKDLCLVNLTKMEFCLVNNPLKGNEGVVFLEIADTKNDDEKPAGKSIFGIFQESL